MAACEILALGEAMVEFNQTGEQGARLWLQGFGGDTSNFVIAAARQGARAGYISALGDDANGKLLLDLWDREGIDRTHVAVDAQSFTGIYFVTHGPGGHEFSFMRKGSAASRMTPAWLRNAVTQAAIESAKVLHISGISLAISESAREACFEAIDIAKAAGVRVSFDTNLRLKLWSIEQAREAMTRAMRLCDICLPSLDDVKAITGLDDPDALVDHCLSLGAKIVALKLGDQGAIIAGAKQRHRLPAHACKPVDATGAGDTFGGAFVARLVAGDSLLDAGRYAVVAAALSTEGYGAVDPIPDLARVREILRAAKP